MQTLIAIIPLLADASSLVDQARNFIAPFILFAISIMALTFLARRETMQFIIFLIFAIVIAAIFYAPAMIVNIGKSLGESNNGTLTWN